jgi:hypothetical protein
MTVGSYAVFASTALGALVGGEMSHYKSIGIALGALVGFVLALPVAQRFVAGATDLFNFTLNEDRNRELFERRVIPTAKVLLFVTGAASIVALILKSLL